jgi:hypothetical protein
MPTKRDTEEKSKMRASFLALTVGFFLAVGLPLAASAGPLPSSSGDGDGDTVKDIFDNCSTRTNASQADTDHDGCGDVCDQPVEADCSGNHVVGGEDFILLTSTFGQSPGSCDADGNGTTGGGDFVILSAQFGNVLGPSGITTANRNYTECPL